jgi:hypothetical protein
VPAAAFAPLALAVVAWLVYCFIDLSRARVRHLPKWAWALVILLSVPVGGIVYLLVGREPG